MKNLIPILALIAFGVMGCAHKATPTTSTPTPAPTTSPSAPLPAPSTGTPAQTVTEAYLVAQAENSAWYPLIRPTIAGLANGAKAFATDPTDLHNKEIIIYDGSKAFWSFTIPVNAPQVAFDPSALTAVVGKWFPSKPWWSTLVAGMQLGLTPIKVWVNNTLSKYGGIHLAAVIQVINDSLNQAALGCQDATYQDLGFPAPPAS